MRAEADRAAETFAADRQMIIVRLMGGLGNQMFQYAAARALALRRGAAVKLDLSHYETDRHRRYELGCFPIAATVATRDDLAAFGLAGRPWPRRLDRVRRTLRARLAPSGFPIRRERDFRFDPAIVALPAPVYLDGYWQSEKYFSDHGEALRREFVPAEPPDQDNARLGAEIDAVNAVSLHVRRGDYVGVAAANRYHGTCSVDYYRAAVEYVRARTPAPHLFVFSDEPQWARTNLEFGVPTTIVDINPPDRGHRDIELMTRCRHHVIANSSFSWWGAWLCRAPAKIVVSPRRWFRADRIDTRDRVPDSWVRM